ncbi:methanethiol S-methyltransferase [Antrihabitans cavernicola]|uniref:methanethiol S-methyltransferase n=1 Tax=Antrihabitans cavernicola TaxID=2495913 RepID=A0A5A7S9Z3_9NOCA|nr:methanethiol S-methyltransferase [Spelaeibacter cavernicola]KAA0021393.1 isoprenylcysteine carboxylmethyltransferase family protein [Spelaeibacter cavernicola]
MAEMVDTPRTPPTLGRGRTLMTAYGAVVYAAFLVVFLYAIGWVEDVVVPHSINDGADAPAGVAVVIDLALVAVFAMQHSVMARPWFKRRWTKIVPQPIERSTYVLLATAALALLMWQWRPLPGTIWDIDSTPIRVAVFAASLGGWGLVLAATFAIDHFDLFGLRQVWRNQRGKMADSNHFRTPLLYRMIRHPLYTGFVIAFWVAPTMTWGRLVFAAGMTGFILIAIRFEERDLVDTFGDDYRSYRSRVPMLIPRLGSRARKS